MKVEVVKTGSVPEQTKRKYPYIGATDNARAVLFTSPMSGTQICNTDNTFGKRSGAWAEYLFTPLVGTVTLSND